MSILLCLISLFIIQGCAHYKPMPLSKSAINKALMPLNEKEIKLKLSSIVHPILKPIPFDLKDGLSPDEAAILAVIQNPRLKAERDNKFIASAQILQADIIPNPEISYSFEAPVGGNTSDKVNAYGINLDWNISYFVTRHTNILSARLKKDSIALSIAWKEWQVAEAAKLNVYHLFILYKELSLMKNIFCLYEQLFIKTRKALKLGLIKKTTFISIENKLKTTKENLISIRSDLNGSWYRLKKILGVPPDMDIKLQNSITLPSIRNIPSLKNIMNGLEERRLDLVALKYGYKSQDKRLRAAILNQFPRINIGFINGRDTDGVKTIGFDIGISLPIFNRNQGKIAIEMATRKKLFDEYVARLFEARSNIASIREHLYLDIQELNLINNSIYKLAKICKICNFAFKKGRIDLFTYYNSMIRLYTQKLEKLHLENKICSLAIALEIASGEYLFVGEKNVK